MIHPLNCISDFAHNGRRLCVVRDCEAISYQFTPTFFTSHKPSQTAETRMHYIPGVVCCPYFINR